MAAGDAILLIEDAKNLTGHLPRELDTNTVYLLNEHQDTQNPLPDRVIAINYDDFVALTVAHSPCLSW